MVATYTTSLGGMPSLLTMDLSKGWDLNAQVEQAMSALDSSSAFLNPEGVELPAAGASGAEGALGGALGGASIGLAIGSMINSGVNAYMTSKTNSVVAKQQKRVDEANKAIAELGAESALRAGESQVAQITYKAGQTKARQRANFAANGVALGEGSVQEVLTNTDVLKELDVRTTQMNALADAWGYKRQAAGFGAQASVAGTISNYYKKSAVGNGLASLIEGGASVAERWYNLLGN